MTSGILVGLVCLAGLASLLAGAVVWAAAVAGSLRPAPAPEPLCEAEGRKRTADPELETDLAVRGLRAAHQAMQRSDTRMALHEMDRALEHLEAARDELLAQTEEAEDAA